VPEPSREEWLDSDRHWNADLFNIVSQISLIDAEHLRTLNTYRPMHFPDVVDPAQLKALREITETLKRLDLLLGKYRF